MTDSVLPVPLTYLTFDSLASGVGASQVAPYVERLRDRGVEVELHTFEPPRADPARGRQLRQAGVKWLPHRFGLPGAKGGLERTLRAAWHIRGAPLVHARSDMAAGAALLARSPHWVWDVRQLWADVRISTGDMERDSAEHRVMSKIERHAARGAARVITLTEAVIEELERRHGSGMGERVTVIPTCVDLDRFRPAAGPLRPTDPRMMFIGTMSEYYDVTLMLEIVRRLRQRVGGSFEVVSPARTAWEQELSGVDVRRSSHHPDEMPGVIAEADLGLSVCRQDVGMSLMAAMPTKIAEFLACGRPVVVNRGLGDMDGLLAEYRAGVVVDGQDNAAIERAVEEVVALLADPELPERCRVLAEAHFDLEVGVDRLVDVYRRALAS